jgi:hypothetical protein
MEELVSQTELQHEAFTPDASFPTVPYLPPGGESGVYALLHSRQHRVNIRAQMLKVERLTS